MAETWAWIDADGNSFPMNLFAEGMEVTEGVTGRGIPPIRRVRHNVAGQPGSVLDDVKHDMRTLQVPVLLQASNESDRTALIRDWSHRFDPERGPSILDLVAADSTERLLTASYASGLEVVEDASNRFPGTQAAVLTFESDDPYFYDTVQQSESFGSSGTSTPWFLDPTKSILPVSLSSSAILGSATVATASDVEVWPIWTVIGPGSELVIRNNTSGRQFLWGGTLTAGQQLIIDTRPGVKTLLSDTDVNLFGGLTAWDLWPLLAGDNDLEVTMAGTDLSSEIDLAWTDRFLTA